RGQRLGHRGCGLRDCGRNLLDTQTVSGPAKSRRKRKADAHDAEFPTRSAGRRRRANLNKSWRSRRPIEIGGFEAAGKLIGHPCITLRHKYVQSFP
ncbi:MAG: hypothetical protein QOI93_5515, partial [Rhodospirillaceae bacterium]|nr:hypothetical protein [Rhodospirillaceae bacterium]